MTLSIAAFLIIVSIFVTLLGKINPAVNSLDNGRESLDPPKRGLQGAGKIGEKTGGEREFNCLFIVISEHMT